MNNPENSSEDNIRTVTIKVPKAKKKKVVKIDEEPKSEKDIKLDTEFPSINKTKSNNLGINTRWHFRPAENNNRSNTPQSKNTNYIAQLSKNETKNKELEAKKSNEKDSNLQYQPKRNNDYNKKNEKHESENFYRYKQNINNQNKKDDNIKRKAYNSNNEYENNNKQLKKVKIDPNKIKSSYHEDDEEKSSNIKNSKNNPSKSNIKSKAPSYNYDSDDSESSSNKNQLKNIKNKQKQKNVKNKLFNYSEEDEDDHEIPPKKQVKNVKNKMNQKNIKNKAFNKSEDEEEDEDYENLPNRKTKDVKNKSDKAKKGQKNKNNYEEEDDDDDEIIINKQLKNKQNQKNVKNKAFHKSDDEEEDDDYENVPQKKSKNVKNKMNQKNVKNKSFYKSDDEDDDEDYKKVPQKQSKNIKSKSYHKSDDEDDDDDYKKVPQKQSKNVKNKSYHKSDDEEEDDDYENVPQKQSKNVKNKMSQKNVKNKSHHYNDEEEENEDENVSKSKSKNRKKQMNKEISNKRAKSKHKKTESTSKHSKRKVKKPIPETVSYKTYIEIDMHGKDKRIKKALDWVSIIRDALFDALEKKVDKVSFITGRGSHSIKKRAVLQPLVLLTAKRLGFDAKLKAGNPGIVECDTTSYKEIYLEEEEEEEDNNDIDNDRDIYISQENADLYRTFNVGKIKIDYNYYEDKKVFFYDDIGQFKDDEFEKSYHYKKSVFKAVKRRYRYMPNLCIEIICLNREKKEALKFAGDFQKALDKNDFEGVAKVSKKLNLVAEKNEQNLREMKMIKSLEREYGLEREIISHVVREKKNKKKARIILDRIVKEIPDEFYVYLATIFDDYPNFPSKSLLDIAHEKNYVYTDVNEQLISKSIAAMGQALDVLNVDNKIESKRKDGSPKSIPTIEIDLSNAGIKKAEISIERIIIGLSNGNYSKMVLKFSKNPKFCKIKDVRTIIKNIARAESVSIREIFEKSKNRYSFAIINDDNDFKNEEEDYTYNEEEDYTHNGEDDENVNYSSESERVYSSEDDY